MDNCPKCKVSFIGEPIPADIVEHYAGTHWRREIGYDGGYMDIYDGIVAYKCPDCNHFFPRGEGKWALDVFNKFINKMNEGDKNES